MNSSIKKGTRGHDLPGGMLPHCPEMTERPTEHPFIGSELHSSARIAFITVASVEVVVGVFGNLLLINSMLSSQSFNISHVHNLFIANLALSDLIPLAYWMPFFILDLILGYHPVVNNTHCMVNGYIVGTCLGVSDRMQYFTIGLCSKTMHSGDSILLVISLLWARPEAGFLSRYSFRVHFTQRWYMQCCTVICVFLCFI